MTKRRWSWIAVVAVFLVALVGIPLSIYGGTYIVRMPQDELQQRIDEAIAKRATRAVGGRAAYAEPKSARVDLGEHSLKLYVVVEGRRFNRDFSLTASALGRPEYRAKEGSFFFKTEDIKVEKFAYAGTPLAETITAAADRYVTNPGLKRAAQDLAPKIEAWTVRVAEVGAKTALEHFPVYKLKNDFKGIAVKAMLSEVKVENGAVVATLSLWQLTWTVLTFVFALIMAIAFMAALAMHPGWGTVALVGMSLN